MKKSLMAIISVAIVTSTLLAGCSTATEKQAQETTKRKDSIVYSINTAPQGIFNPLISDIAVDDYVDAVVYASLMTVNDKGNIEPYLAKEFNVSEDQKTIKYKLVDNGKWHDGKSVTANDVAFTFKSMADPGYTGGYYGDVEKIKGAKDFHDGKSKNIEGIRVISNTEIEIEFNETYAPGVTNLGTVNIIPEHIWGKIPPAEWKKQTALLNNPIGCGPYRLSQYENGAFVKFEANENFFKGLTKTSNLVFKVVNPDTIQSEFKAGTIDIANVETLRKADMEVLLKDGYASKSFPNFQFTYMGFNLRKDTLKDARLRQAFMYAINRRDIVDKVIEGRGQIVNAPMLPSSWAYPEETKLDGYDYNLDKAKSLLKEAGWRDENGDGIVENSNGEPLKLSLVCQTNHPKREQTAIVIQESLKALGVDIEIETMDFSAVMDKVVANHDFDLYMMGNTLSLDPDPRPMWHSYAISNKKGEVGYNIVSYENKKTDELIEKGNSTLDNDLRKEIYTEFAQILNNDVPEVYLFCQDIERVYNSNLTGYEPSTFNEFYNVNNWEIVKK